jgi:hypothetical protein
LLGPLLSSFQKQELASFFSEAVSDFNTEEHLALWTGFQTVLSKFKFVKHSVLCKAYVNFISTIEHGFPFPFLDLPCLAEVAPYLTGSTKGASLLETSDSDSDIIGNTLTGLGLSRVAETSCLDSQGSSRDSSETLEPVDSPLKPALIRPTSPLAKSLNDSFGIDWDNVEVNIIKNVSTYFLTHY